MRWSWVLLMAVALAPAPGEARGEARGWTPESKRLGQAKDYIADEQWTRAIAELRAVVDDRKEQGRDEALYWLAHSLNQAGDPAGAIDAIRRLEREYPASLWVKPAGSLRLDIAVHLQRHDVLWWTAAPPPPPPAPKGPPTPRATPAPPPPPAAPPPEKVRLVPPKPAPAPPSAVLPPVPPAAPTPAAAPIPMAPPVAWLPDSYQPDMDLRIQALGSLIRTDAVRVIPILKEIALESPNAGEARRAVFVLAQSGKAEARDTVVQVAKTGPELVRVAAVRELGRFGGPEISQELLEVYSMGDVTVKRQVVSSLGERFERAALLQIAESEPDPLLKEKAIVTLGQSGGGEQLRLLYGRADSNVKLPIILGLFNARAEDELIRIAEQEKDARLRDEAIRRLQLMGTPRAKEYLQKIGRIR